MENNDNKLELLTKKIYEEGIEKAQEDDQDRGKSGEVIRLSPNAKNKTQPLSTKKNGALRRFLFLFSKGYPCYSSVFMI